MTVIAIICATLGVMSLEYIGYMFCLAIIDILIGLFMGYTFTSFSFAGFMIRRDNKKLSFTTTPSRLTAETHLLRKEMTANIKLIFATFEVIFMTIIVLVTQYIFVRFGVLKNQYTKYIGITLGIIWVVHFLVYISWLKKAASKGYDHYIWEQEIIISNRIKNGYRPKDNHMIEVELDEKSMLGKRCILYNYYHLLDNEEYDELKPYIDRFEEIIGNVNNIIASNVPYAYEIVYYYSVVDVSLTKAEHYVDLLGELLKNDMDMNGRRVYAAYLLGTNKLKDSVRKAIDEGLQDDNRMSEQVNSGMEAKLLNDLKENLYK